MTTINQTLGAEGAGKLLTTDSKTYTFSPITQRHKARIDAWLEDRSWAPLLRSKKHFDSEGYQTAVSNHVKEIQTGKYQAGSSYYEQEIKTLDGIRFFMRLQLETHHPDITDDEIDSIVENYPERLERLLEDFYPELVEEVSPATATQEN